MSITRHFFQYRTLLVFMLLAQLMSVTYKSGSAQSAPNAQAGAMSPTGVAELSFQQLGTSLLDMRAPHDIEEIALNLPYRWQVKGTENDNFLQLNYDLNISGTDASSKAISVVFDLYINDDLIADLTLEKGAKQTVRIPLPPESFEKVTDNRHTVRLELSADYPDGEVGELRLLVSNQSFFHLQYDSLPPEMDLASLPRPLFQELPTREKIVLVLPDEYSDADLTIAASVAATIGQKTFTSVDVELIQAKDATPEKLANSSAIIIGRPDQNKFLHDLYQRDVLPTTLVKTRTIVDPNGEEVALNKGVVQLVQSEYNPNYVYLVVTGGSDEGVALAARAISATKAALRLGFNTNWAVVEQFAEAEPDQRENNEILSFSQLGFRGATLYGIGTQLANLEFFVPSSWRLTGDPILNLSYVSSAAIQSAGSGLTVMLNNQPIGTVALNVSTQGAQELAIHLPQDEIRMGERNRLRFEVTMVVNDPSISRNTRVAWTRIRPNGYVQIPHTENAIDATALPIDNPIMPLVSRADLSDVWFALPQTPLPEELSALVRTASLLGRISGGPGFMPHISRGDVVTDAVTNYNVVMIGQPMRNPVIGLVNDHLPQSFIPGENSLRQRVGNVEFRLTEAFNVGVLETTYSPWNPQKYITVISGSTPEAISWVIDAMLDDELYYSLNGDLVFIRGRQVEALNVEQLLPERSVVTAVPTAIAQLVISSNITTPITSSVAFVAVPTPIEPTPVLAPLPEQYKPIAQQLPFALQMTVWGLIAGGVFAIAAGLFWNGRRARS